MKPIRVLIVDDSLLMRSMFSEMLSSEPDIEVVDTASDPFEAREKIKQFNPDVLTLDIEMPKMDGLSFLEKIMKLRPMPVIMISTLTQRGADASIRALELGAFDTLPKPTEQHTQDTLSLLHDLLVMKIRAAAAAKVGMMRTHVKEYSVVPFHAQPGGNRHVVAIGSSTGGVETLKYIFQRLPANVPPIVMTQHMPERFTQSFAARLDSVSAVKVVEAQDNMPVEPGCAYLAPGSHHLKLVRSGNLLQCRIYDGPLISGHKPSVDVLFESVAETVGGNAVGVILTGMGKDGASGLKTMRDRGAYTIGQNAATCVVYGMPQAAFKAGAVAVELPVEQIPEAMLRYCEQHKAAS